MPVILDRFIQLRPFLYHVTARANQIALTRDRRIEPAAALFRRAGRTDLLRWRRPDAVTVQVDGDQIVIKDQRPLIEANLSLDGAWELADFVEYLNEHVFFWPGRSEGPIQAGVRLHGRYEASAPLVLRVPTRDLIEANPAVEPLFCPFNSGAPRHQGGRRARRGPRLFTPAADFPRRESEVIELAFRTAVGLPDTTQIRVDDVWTAFGTRAA